MMPDRLVAALADALRARGLCIATAESCTGGLIAGACTELAGSSDWFDRGFVTYSNEAKTEMLGVDAALIASQGAVSEPVARAMAGGALVRSRADLAVAVTGVAGPGGGSACRTPIALPNGSYDVKIVLGEADVREDGSAIFKVPARTPVYFQAIDRNGQVVGRFAPDMLPDDPLLIAAIEAALA